MKQITIAALAGLCLGLAPAYGAGAAPKLEKAVLAGGCFWCMVHPFDEQPGVKEVLAGYAGGTGKDPGYGDYAEKGYIEAIQITYDPSLISYTKLLDIFWRQIDPTDAGGQFVDRGPQYASAIFYTTPEQKKAAEASKAALAASGRFSRPIVTPVRRAGVFYKAEEYHQNYYKKNPFRYKYYRYRSGRDKFLKKTWGKEVPVKAAAGPAGKKGAYMKPSDAELKKRLTPLQYKVTQEGGTEPSFKNEYWDNHREGIYVDIVSGEPLFSSLDKFDSGTGWPSFTRPLEPGNVVEGKKSIFSGGAEIRSRNADSHLGDVFTDGPKPTGLRYCLDSAALRFIPKKDLEKEGFGGYLKLFEKKR